MRVYVQSSLDVYGIVYMLAPKEDKVHVRLIWLPEHLMSESTGVCHYELQFEAQTPDVYAQWMDGLPEILLNWHGKRTCGTEIPASENVLRIEHDTPWEFNFLINMAAQPDWRNQDADFDLWSKLSGGVRANAESKLRERDDWLEVDKSETGETE